jgi:hypothetical protein
MTKSACVVMRIETEGPHHGVVAEEPGVSGVESVISLEKVGGP